MNGYAGKILQIDLTGKKISTIPTEKYKSWVGGHGMGSAIFFDLVKDKTIQGFTNFRDGILPPDTQKVPHLCRWAWRTLPRS